MFHFISYNPTVWYLKVCLCVLLQILKRPSDFGYLGSLLSSGPCMWPGAVWLDIRTRGGFGVCVQDGLPGLLCRAPPGIMHSVPVDWESTPLSPALSLVSEGRLGLQTPFTPSETSVWAILMILRPTRNGEVISTPALQRDVMKFTC